MSTAVFQAIPWEEKYPDFEARRRFALAIRDYWSEFERRVPRLSPNKRDWILNELGGVGERLRRALESSEFAILQLNRRSALCIDVASSILAAQDDLGAREVEMLYWLKLVNCYDGTNDIEAYLSQAGITHGADTIETEAAISVPPSSLIQGIIVNKAAPAAMAETMGWTFEPPD